MAFVAKEAQMSAMIVIFPEGEITRWKISPFKRGVERMLSQHKVPVVPMVFKGLWGHGSHVLVEKLSPGCLNLTEGVLRSLWVILWV